MEILISNASGLPIYEQITTQIKQKILSGELVAGKGCFVAARNREWIREELLRQIETHLEKVAELAAQADVSGEELCEMLRARREEVEP